MATKSREFMDLPQELQEECLSYLIPADMTIEVTRNCYQAKHYVHIKILTARTFNDFRSLSLVCKKFKQDVMGVLYRSITAVTIDIRKNGQLFEKKAVLRPPPSLPHGIFKNVICVQIIAPYSIRYWRSIGIEHVVGHVSGTFERDTASENGWIKKEWSTVLISSNRPHNGIRQPGDTAHCLKPLYVDQILLALTPEPLGSRSMYKLQRAFSNRHDRTDRDRSGRPWWVFKTEVAVRDYELQAAENAHRAAVTKVCFENIQKFKDRFTIG